MSLRRESRRLSRVFGALVLAIGPAAGLAQACTDSSPDAAGVDARVEGGVVDGGLDDEAAADVVAVIGPLDAACATVGEMVLDAGDSDALPDADLGCRYTLPCGLPDATGFDIIGCQFFQHNADPGTDASLGCWVPDENGCVADAFAPKPGASITFQCLDCFGGGGRKPKGLRRVHSACNGNDSPLGDYFARMAHDEAASIRAFRDLHDELVRFGAPAELQLAAQRSARDEARHARSMAREAKRNGAQVPSPRVRKPTARSLEAIARENAVEGCIFETYGALQMRFQAQRAPDAALRALFARVAADETRHAALSWLVAEWAESQLDPRARARVRAARSRALAKLRRTLDRPESDVDPRIGRPARAEALALLDGLTQSLAA